MDLRPAEMTPAKLRRVLLAAGLALAAASATAQDAASEAAPAVAGKRIYTAKCARCHGFNMVNPGTISYDLRKFPADEHERFVRSVNDGKGAMPAWRGVLQEGEIEAVWAYVLTRGQQ